MDENNIFSALQFTPVKDDDLMMSKQNIDKINILFLSEIFGIPETTQQIYITRTLEDEAFAISTAENSSLTAAEASKIQVTEEQSLRLKKYQSSSEPIEKKYEKLEYENIISVSSQSTGISFQQLDIEILCQLHHDLTVGLDDYTGELKISKYHSGQLRMIDTVKVGKFPPYLPPKHTEISRLLETLFAYYQGKNKINLVDILEFGILLYAIHPFQNGNKRITRVIESALLEFYDYNAKGSISLGRYYSMEKTGFSFFLLSALNSRNTTAFVNFALRGYINEGENFIAKMVKNTAATKFYMHILPSLSEKKRKQYDIAFRLFIKHDLLKNSMFTKIMKESGYTHSVSQNILRSLVDDNVIQKLPDNFYVLFEFNRYIKLKNQLDALMKP